MFKRRFIAVDGTQIQRHITQNRNCQWDKDRERKRETRSTWNVPSIRVVQRVHDLKLLFNFMFTFFPSYRCMCLSFVSGSDFSLLLRLFSRLASFSPSQWNEIEKKIAATTHQQPKRKNRSITTCNGASECEHTVVHKSRAGQQRFALFTIFMKEILLPHIKNLVLC